MRKIVINDIIYPDLNSNYTHRRKYCVALGNSTRVYFDNLKDAKKYLADTNRFLNNKLHELNYIYINVFAEYRKLWFYFAEKQMQRYEQDINETFKVIDFKFQNLYRVNYTVNGNYFAFLSLDKIARNIREVFSIIIEVQKAKKFYADAQRVYMFDTQAHRIIMELKNYNKTGIDQVDILELE